MIDDGMPTIRRAARDFGGPSTSSRLTVQRRQRHADDACGQVKVAAAERGYLSPAQTGEGGQENEGAVAPVVVVICSAVIAEGPQGRFGCLPGEVDLRRGAHGAMPPVPQPVMAIWKTPDVADRAATDQFGRSRSRLTTKIHLSCEQGQKVQSLVVTAGQRGDLPQFQAVLDGINVPCVGAGRP